MKTIPRTQREVLAILAACGRIHAYELKLRLKDVLGHSSVYAALARAEAKGYVKTEWEEPFERPLGSGPPRKYFELTVAGHDALMSAEMAPDLESSRQPAAGEASAG
jgi:DNA-binding PadR family transcriptional regulator